MMRSTWLARSMERISNVVASPAGQRVMTSIRGFLERRMRLQVNEEKSGVRKPEEVHFLGFGFRCRKDGGEVAVLLCVFNGIQIAKVPRGRCRLLRYVSHRLTSSARYQIDHLTAD